MTLEKLQEIARAATENELPGYKVHFYNTFNPRLIEKMLAEIKAARDCGCSEWGGNKHAVDKAREALNAELAAL